MIGQNEKIKPVFDKIKKTRCHMVSFRSGVLMAKVQKQQLELDRDTGRKLLLEDWL